jgi:hypothetical protein
MKRLCDEQFAHFRTICVGCIDEIHAEFDRPAEDFPRVISIGRPTPYTVTRDAHRAKAKSINREIAAQAKRSLSSCTLGGRVKFL